MIIFIPLNLHLYIHISKSFMLISFIFAYNYRVFNQFVIVNHLPDFIR